MGYAIKGILERHKPYIAIILAEATYASLTLLSKATITKGMNPYVFVVYRQAFATLALTPLAFFFEKRIMASLNLFYVAMHYIAATLAAAASTTVPTITFVMAVLLRAPPINLNWWSSSKGKEIPSPFVQHGSKRKWIKGSLLMLSSSTAWALWLIMQAPLVKQYTSKLRLVTLQCFFSCLQSAVLAMATQRNLSSWKPGSGFNLFTVAYCGAMVTAFGFWMRVWAIEQKGPVFAGMFTPLALIITVIFSAIVWKEIHHLGSVCGAILLVGGLYSVLWGKSRDIQEKKLSNEQKPETKEETALAYIT